MGVGGRAVDPPATAKHLGLGGELGVDLQADDRLPLLQLGRGEGGRTCHAGVNSTAEVKLAGAGPGCTRNTHPLHSVKPPLSRKRGLGEGNGA